MRRRFFLNVSDLYLRFGIDLTTYIMSLFSYQEALKKLWRGKTAAPSKNPPGFFFNNTPVERDPL